MPILGVIASSKAQVPQGDYFSIASYLLTTNTASVTFNDGGAWTDYKHLQLRIMARTARGISTDAIVVYFNGNSTSSAYAMGSYYGSGTSINAFYETTAAPNSFGGIRAATVPASTATSSVYGGQTIDILDFANTNKKPVIRGQGGYATNNTGYEVIVFGGIFNVTGAITSITVKGYGDSMVANSRISLYGIKG